MTMTLDPSCTPPTRSAQVTGNAGLYYACFRLSLMGWNAMPTARNARGIDVLAYSSDGTRKVGLQVKSLSKRNPVPLGTSIDRLMGDFWLVVTNVGAQPESYVLLPEEVRRLAHRGEKDGRVSFWLQPRSYDVDAFREAWVRIGVA
jgi:hypothetical protein